MTSATPQQDARLLALQAENEQLRSALKKALGVGTPFICGMGTEIDKDGLPSTLHVCPAYGLDGFAVYRKVSDYTAPSY